MYRILPFLSHVAGFQQRLDATNTSATSETKACLSRSLGRLRAAGMTAARTRKDIERAKDILIP